MSDIKRVKGYISPRYLDIKWFKNFTISRDLRKESDIPVIVEFCHESYNSYKNDNDLLTYSDIENNLLKSESKIQHLEKLLTMALGGHTFIYENENSFKNFWEKQTKAVLTQGLKLSSNRAKEILNNKDIQEFLKGSE